MNDHAKEHVTRELTRVRSEINLELQRILAVVAQGPAARMYHMLSYFLGFLDENFQPQPDPVGKRFRSSLCLLIAEMYGAKKQALESAMAIELFHNATLIHDDVEDRDEMRRGRPTLWKLYGVNHAINAGDAQLTIVAYSTLLASQHSRVGFPLAHLLHSTFAQVWEGQYLDFQMGNAVLSPELITEEHYLLTIKKKTGVLVGLAAEVAGVAAGLSNEECTRLREYGTAFGIAHQIANDYASIWSSDMETGKDVGGDIREHKRTLPYIYAMAETDVHGRNRLEDLYSSQRQLSNAEITEIRLIMDATGTRNYVHTQIREYSLQARAAVEKLSLGNRERKLLNDILDTLIVV